MIQPADTCFAQGAREDAHHVVQVAVGGHLNVHFVPSAGHVTVGDGAHRVAVGRGRRPRRAQGQEIVPAHELLRCPLHLCFVQPLRHTGVVGRIKGRINGVVVDAV